MILFLFSCSPPEKKDELTLYKTYCASCHLPPDINSLPKTIWEENILPEMGARLGIRDSVYSPYKGLSFQEMEAVIKTGIYSPEPIIDPKDWIRLKNYIIRMAPESLPIVPELSVLKDLSLFTVKDLTFKDDKGSFITHLDLQETESQILIGDLYGNLQSYNFKNKEVQNKGKYGSPVVGVTYLGQQTVVTAIGNIRPTEISTGLLFQVDAEGGQVLPLNFHRPAFTQAFDLNKNGIEELLVSEFGDINGQLTLLYKDSKKEAFKKKTLLNSPGAIKTVIADMNNDGFEDIVVLNAQGDEGISILYNKNNLDFELEKVLRFSPVFGSSWFELIDYNEDGYLDIVTVNGDNADKSYVMKPYHGMRIHLNDGNNSFEEAFFYPMNGATRFKASDFDQDGDTDFALISTFPDYSQNTVLSFIYLENTNSEIFDFEAKTFETSNSARWFLMDTGDIDMDGDEDIILSSFSYGFTPVPESFKEVWEENNIDLLLLENNLN
ncbi:FG-GAP repeat domain-containing protein [Eudoraea sp.]|uniref:FG-GAP repeat domain-containing protein n=1 Tax=Eudoraea sp. TaxID=1979955 RepID=UPI003C7178E3